MLKGSTDDLNLISSNEVSPEFVCLRVATFVLPADLRRVFCEHRL